MAQFGVSGKILTMKFPYKNFITGTFFCVIAGGATYSLFHSDFAKSTIDYLSFIAGAFLIIDGVLAISRSPGRPFSGQVARYIRIVFGFCIILIHLDQFLRHRIMSSSVAEIKIDYVDYLAVSASVFLIAEGLTKILASRSPVFPGQLTRLFRVILGAVILSIHILQFIHCWGKP